MEKWKCENITWYEMKKLLARDIWSNIRAALEFRQSNDFKRLHPMTLSTLQDFVDRHCQWAPSPRPGGFPNDP